MSDVPNADTAAWLQSQLPGWLVLFAPYHRGYSAFGVCTPTGTIIDEPDPEILITRAHAAELAAFSGRPAAAP